MKDEKIYRVSSLWWHAEVGRPLSITPSRGQSRQCWSSNGFLFEYSDFDAESFSLLRLSILDVKWFFMWLNLFVVSDVKWIQIWNQLQNCPNTWFTTTDWLPDTTKCHQNKYFTDKILSLYRSQTQSVGEVFLVHRSPPARVFLTFILKEILSYSGLIRILILYVLDHLVFIRERVGGDWMVLLLCASSDSQMEPSKEFLSSKRCICESLWQKEVVDLFLETIQWYQVQQGGTLVFTRI